MIEKYRPRARMHSIYDITPDYLRERGIEGLVLDIDNTLTTYGCRAPEPHTTAWIETMRQAGIKLCILSNGGRERVSQYNESLRLPFRFRAMKPRRGGFAWAAEQMELPPARIAVIGDQLFTDVAGGNAAGMYTILTDPFAEDEMWLVRLKRILERPILRRLEGKE